MERKQFTYYENLWHISLSYILFSGNLFAIHYQVNYFLKEPNIVHKVTNGSSHWTKRSSAVSIHNQTSTCNNLSFVQPPIIYAQRVVDKSRCMLKTIRKHCIFFREYLRIDWLVLFNDENIEAHFGIKSWLKWIFSHDLK
jgi:hypothetical protein